MRQNWFHVMTALARVDMHGASIAEDVLEQTGGELRLWPATLYRTLEEMVAAGLIEELAGEEHPSGESQRRRYYRATPRGRLELARAADRLAEYAVLARSRLRPGGSQS